MLQNSILNEHWLFFWAPDINALQIFRTFREIAIGLVVLYWACLLIAVLRHFLCRTCRPGDDQKKARHELEHAVQERRMHVGVKGCDRFGFQGAKAAKV